MTWHDTPEWKWPNPNYRSSRSKVYWDLTKSQDIWHLTSDIWHLLTIHFWIDLLMMSKSHINFYISNALLSCWWNFGICEWIFLCLGKFWDLSVNIFGFIAKFVWVSQFFWITEQFLRIHNFFHFLTMYLFWISWWKSSRPLDF